MNQNRDGQKRHTITKGKANYWPNRWESAPPATASEGGYVDYPEKVAGIKTRLKSRKFKDHISQAQLFWNSQSPPEKMHLISALGFELGKALFCIISPCSGLLFALWDVGHKKTALFTTHFDPDTCLIAQISTQNENADFEI